jgi:hypothetical protein
MLRLCKPLRSWRRRKRDRKADAKSLVSMVTVKNRSCRRVGRWSCSCCFVPECRAVSSEIPRPGHHAVRLSRRRARVRGSADLRPGPCRSRRGSGFVQREGAIALGRPRSHGRLKRGRCALQKASVRRSSPTRRATSRGCACSAAPVGRRSSSAVPWERATNALTLMNAATWLPPATGATRQPQWVAEAPATDVIGFATSGSPSAIRRARSEGGRARATFPDSRST